MKQISAIELRNKLAQGEDLLLLDVREDYEHADFNIGGKLIPLGEVIRKAGEIPKDKLVVVYCRKGIRSQIAIQRLEAKFAFTNLVNLAGGIEDWK
jgi:adenylyltransferase/sulfurtransferase